MAGLVYIRLRSDELPVPDVVPDLVASWTLSIPSILPSRTVWMV